MPSTFSPNLKLEIMASGEKAGFWGVITSNNLQYVVEEALVGEANVVFAGADVTLALADSNASQTARNYRLNLTGTFGGTRNLNLPQIKKTYLISNQSAGGDANNVVVRVLGTGGATVTIPSGRTMAVYLNGTDALEASNYSAAFTINALTLPTLSSGGLVIANGGSPLTSLVGAAVGHVPQWSGSAWASAALPPQGVTSVTASGPLASSGGLTPNISLTGQVPVANGGTGRASLDSGALLVGAGTSAPTSLSGTSVGQVPQWNGSAWTVGSLPAGGVTNVTASFPLSSSGGSTPNITLTGTIGIANGGTGASSESGARANLGLGSMATQSSSNVSINGGTISGVGFSSSSVNITGGSISNVSLSGVSISGFVTTNTTETISGAKTFSNTTTFSGTTTFSNAATFSNYVYVNPTGSSGQSLVVGSSSAPTGDWVLYSRGRSGHPAIVCDATIGSTTTGLAAVVNSTGSPYALFFYGTITAYGSAIGGIDTTTGTSVRFNTTSDYRLKENVVPLTNAANRLKQLKPIRFTWKTAPAAGAQDGFLAHELQQVVPEAVSGVKDEVDANGSIKNQQVDLSYVTPLLVAALKEALGRIETLEAKVTALGG